jgi:hypothetical protein
VVFFNGFIVLSSLEPVLLIFNIIKRQQPWKLVGHDDIQSCVTNCYSETVVNVPQLIFVLDYLKMLFIICGSKQLKKKKTSVGLHRSIPLLDFYNVSEFIKHDHVTHFLKIEMKPFPV